MGFLIIGILTGFTVFLIVYKKLLDNKNKKEIETQISTIRKEIYENKKGEIVEQVQKDLDYLYKEKEEVVKEIQEKEGFNNSLKKIRTDELERLIEVERAEKKKTLIEQIKIWEEQEKEFANSRLTQILLKHQEEEENKKNELIQLQSELNEFRSQREAVNEAILREREIQEQEFFYKIDIPKNDQEDIEVLKSIGPQLKNKEALNKLIYEVFIRRPLLELIKRITNGKEPSGIYKITNLKTGEAYIGKSTNIATRWQNHIKTACGLDGAARSTFHNRLEKDGIWNYSFEILEEVPKDNLTSKEKFYIDLYQTDKQLNMRKG